MGVLALAAAFFVSGMKLPEQVQAYALDDYYLVEYYDTSYNLKKTVKVAKELSLFGAFYDDGTNYYILSGQENPEEQKTVEVYRLTKYSHKWKRISSVGVYGAETPPPAPRNLSKSERTASF
jgi:hypothetical protein